jgi:hypothetical protein
MVIEAEHHDVRLDADGRFRGKAEVHGRVASIASVVDDPTRRPRE